METVVRRDADSLEYQQRYAHACRRIMAAAGHRCDSDDPEVVARAWARYRGANGPRTEASSTESFVDPTGLRTARLDFGVGFGSQPGEGEEERPEDAHFERAKNAWKTPSRNRRNRAGEIAHDASRRENAVSGPGGSSTASVHVSGGPSANPSSKSEHGRSAFGGGNQGNNTGGFAGGTDAMTPSEDEWSDTSKEEAAMADRLRNSWRKR